MGLILVTLVCLEPRACWQLLRRRSVRIGVALLVFVGAIAAVFATGGPDPEGPSFDRLPALSRVNGHSDRACPGVIQSVRA